MRRDSNLSPAEFRRQQNGWGHPGWERYPGPPRTYRFEERREPAKVQFDFGPQPKGSWDSDSAVVRVDEPGTYRVKWDVGTSRFVLVAIDLDTF